MFRSMVLLFWGGVHGGTVAHASHCIRYTMWVM
jgi:hypothetical protein